MIIGFARHGSGNGASAIHYLTDGADHPALKYLTGSARGGKPRSVPPVIVRGDPALTAKLIRTIPHKWRYTSGVLSFSSGERITPEMEERIINRFEEAAFVGLRPGNYNILWVRHEDKGRHELHFLVPRVALNSGRSLNIAPPGKQNRELFDTFRKLVNDEFGLSDPDHPARARCLYTPARFQNGIPDRESLRSTIESFLSAQFQAERIKNRDDVIQLLRQGGYSISRIGTDYLTVVDGFGSRCRLKGSLFKKDFRPPPLVAAPERRLSIERRLELENKFNQLLAKRAEYNQGRYPEDKEPEQSSPPLNPELETKRVSHDRIGTTSDWRLRPIDERINGAREENQRAVEQFERAALELGRQSDRFNSPGRELGAALESARLRCQERLLDQALINRFGPAPAPALPNRRRELDREFVMERL